MGCRRPARGAASSLAKLLRRPRCTLRGARMTACTALQIRIGFVDLGRRNCSACMRKAWCHQCAYPVAIGAPNSSPRLLRTSPSARVGCMHAHRNSAINVRIGARALSPALQRPRVAQRGCWLYLVRAAQRLALGLVLFIGRARRRGARVRVLAQGRKCQGQP